MKKLLVGVLSGLVLVGCVPYPAHGAGSCSVFRTWVAGDSFTPTDVNSSFATVGVTNMIPTCMDAYSANATQMQSSTDPYPAQSESLPTTLAGELQRLRYTLKTVFGTSQWYKYTDAFSFGPTNLTGTNLAGNSLTLHGAAGTGTGVGGNVLGQVAYPGTTGSSANAFTTVFKLNGTNNASSGNGNAMFTLSPTVNMSGTAGYTAFLQNVTETAIGSGSNLLADFQVGGVSKFSIDRTGAVTMAGAITSPFTAGSVVFAGASGVYSQDNTNFYWDNTAKILKPSSLSIEGIDRIAAGASKLTIDQQNTTISRLISWGPNASTVGTFNIQVARSDGTGSVSVAFFGPGIQVGTPTGGDKGVGTLNLQGDIYMNNTASSGTGGVVRTTAPTMTGGSHTAIATLGLRDNSVAFDLFLTATSFPLATANRTLTINVQNSDPTLVFGGGGTLTFPVGTNTIPSVSNNLSVFAATTSSQLAGVLSDETGSGAAVFATSPTLVTPTLGAASGTSLTLSTPLVVTSGGSGTATAMTTGSVIFAGASGVHTQDNTYLFFDNTNKYLRTGMVLVNKAVVIPAASQMTMDQYLSTTSRILGWGPDNTTTGLLLLGVCSANCSAGGTSMVLGLGVQVGTPTGGDKGAGTLNVQAGYYARGNAGITQTITLCGGTITVTDGIITGTTC